MGGPWTLVRGSTRVFGHNVETCLLGVLEKTRTESVTLTGTWRSNRDAHCTSNPTSVSREDILAQETESS